jgi:hypothetical protein
VKPQRFMSTPAACSDRRMPVSRSINAATASRVHSAKGELQLIGTFVGDETAQARGIPLLHRQLLTRGGDRA